MPPEEDEYPWASPNIFSPDVEIPVTMPTNPRERRPGDILRVGPAVTGAELIGDFVREQQERASVPLQPPPAPEPQTVAEGEFNISAGNRASLQDLNAWVENRLLVDNPFMAGRGQGPNVAARAAEAIGESFFRFSPEQRQRMGMPLVQQEPPAPAMKEVSVDVEKKVRKIDLSEED